MLGVVERGEEEKRKCWVWWRGGGRKEEKGFFLVGGKGSGGNTGTDLGNTEDAGKHRKERWKE